MDQEQWDARSNVRIVFHPKAPASRTHSKRWRDFRGPFKPAANDPMLLSSQVGVRESGWRGANHSARGGHAPLFAEPFNQSPFLRLHFSFSVHASCADNPRMNSFPRKLSFSVQWLFVLGIFILGGTWARAADEPTTAATPKKHVLILGDSISIGYTPFVQQMLSKEAVVVRPMNGNRPENCDGTTKGVQAIDRWLKLEGGKWDVIHFNFGLHDLKRVNPQTGQASNNPEDLRQAEPEAYERQLQQIVARLETTGAKLIWATTTPVPTGGVKPHRDVEDVSRYNRTALRIMREHGIAIDDLYSLALPQLEKIQLPVNVHFTKEGYQLLAAEVARHIRTAFGVSIPTATNRPRRRPNVIVIMTDDQGTIDANCYGATDLLTPGIDELAERGVRFTQFYSGAPVCSPSRAALLTGKYPLHAGMPGNASSSHGGKGMPTTQVTMAETFKAAGYATAHIGKWHLGYEPDSMPNGQGFDYSFGHMGGCIDNYSHFFYWAGPNRHDLWRNGKEVYEPGKFFPDLMLAEAVRFIEQHREQPFFLYFAMNTPHYPYQGKPCWLEQYRNLPYPRNLYAAFVSTLDVRVRQLITKLDELGFAPGHHHRLSIGQRVFDGRTGAFRRRQCRPVSRRQIQSL